MKEIKVPEALIVTKCRDFLAGYMCGVIDTKKQYNIGAALQSEDGQMPENMIEDKNKTLMADAIFDMHCPKCGNYYAFKKWEEVPDVHFYCGLCDFCLIFYTDVEVKKLNENQKQLEENQEER